MFKKRKNIEVKKNIFNIPSDEAKGYLTSILQDVKEILESDNFMELSKKIKVPKDANIKDYENIVKKVAPRKIYALLELFIGTHFDNIVRILSAIFVTDYEEYKKKSIEEMCNDLSTLSAGQIAKIISFFHH